MFGLACRLLELRCQKCHTGCATPCTFLFAKQLRMAPCATQTQARVQMCQTPCCAFCYERLSSGDSMHCEQCAKRLYCSKRCQAADWAHGHRLWCGVCGELDHDYAIEPRPGKDLALVALRPFKKCDTVMVERPLLRTPHRSPPDAGMSSSEAAAVWALTPARGSMLTKIYNNQMSCRADASFRESGVFVAMARVNHSCLPTAEQYDSERDGVKRLIACHAIATGFETCISQSAAQLRAHYSFDCSCECAACESSCCCKCSVLWKP